MSGQCCGGTAPSAAASVHLPVLMTESMNQPTCYRNVVLFLIALWSFASTGELPGQQANPNKPFDRDQLVAWCIVPFDGKERGPAARAEMLKRLGLRRVAYDWREKHVATFEEEILQYKKHGEFEPKCLRHTKHRSFQCIFFTKFPSKSRRLMKGIKKN